MLILEGSAGSSPWEPLLALLLLRSSPRFPRLGRASRLDPVTPTCWPGWQCRGSQRTALLANLRRRWWSSPMTWSPGSWRGWCWSASPIRGRTSGSKPWHASCPYRHRGGACASIKDPVRLVARMICCAGNDYLTSSSDFRRLFCYCGPRTQESTGPIADSTPR